MAADVPGAGQPLYRRWTLRSLEVGHARERVNRRREFRAKRRGSGSHGVMLEGRWRRIRHRVERSRPHGDAGISLIELVTAMTITALVMASFTAAATQMFRAASDTETIANAQSQLNLRFIRLDKEIRYAAAIAEPSAPDATGSSVVEYLRTDEGTPTCTQLWLDGIDKVLRSRTWVEVTEDPDLGTWAVLTTNVSAATPFTLISASGASEHQRLRVQLTISAEGRAGRSKRMDVTFTALNTHRTAPTTPVCTGGRPPE